jgi:hypothetical protein
MEEILNQIMIKMLKLKKITSDNKMYAIQAGFERFTNNSFDNFIIHYHNYDRKYNEQGTSK